MRKREGGREGSSERGGLWRHERNRLLLAVLLHRGIETGTMIDREVAAFTWTLILRWKLDKMVG